MGSGLEELAQEALTSLPEGLQALRLCATIQPHGSQRLLREALIEQTARLSNQLDSALTQLVGAHDQDIRARRQAEDRAGVISHIPSCAEWLRDNLHGLAHPAHHRLLDQGWRLVRGPDGRVVPVPPEPRRPLFGPAVYEPPPQVA